MRILARVKSNVTSALHHYRSQREAGLHPKNATFRRIAPWVAAGWSLNDVYSRFPNGSSVHTLPEDLRQILELTPVEQHINNTLAILAVYGIAKGAQLVLDKPFPSIFTAGLSYQALNGIAAEMNPTINGILLGLGYGIAFLYETTLPPYPNYEQDT